MGSSGTSSTSPPQTSCRVGPSALCLTRSPGIWLTEGEFGRKRIGVGDTHLRFLRKRDWLFVLA